MNAGVIYLLSYGFKYAKLGVGTLLTSIELVLGPLFAYLLFHERILANEIVGGIFIVLATIMVAYKSD